MECVYQLLISSLHVPWKSYLMATDSYLFPFLLTSEQECFSMCMVYSCFGMGTIIHYAGETVIRYWYVKSSMRPELREGFTKRKILYICLGIPQILLLTHVMDSLRLYVTKGQFPTLLYQACLDPNSDYSIPFYTLLPFNVTMTYIYILTGAYNNLYLYRFLRYNFLKIYLRLFSVFHRNKEGDVRVKLKSEYDKKRDRKRNLVPAKTGIYILILLVIYTIISCVSYISFSDLGTRAYFMSLAFDILSCIIAPGLIVFQAPSIRRKMNKTFLSIQNHINMSEVRGNNPIHLRRSKGLV